MTSTFRLKICSITSQSAQAQLDANWVSSLGRVLVHLSEDPLGPAGWWGMTRWKATEKLMTGVYLATRHFPHKWKSVAISLKFARDVLWPKSSHNYTTEMYLKLLKWLYRGSICSSIWCPFKQSAFSWITFEMCFWNWEFFCSQFRAEKEESGLHNLRVAVVFF